MSRDEAIEILSDMRAEYNLFGDEKEATRYHVLSWAIQEMKAAQPEVKPISYADCANATMMMWIDKVLTDGEYKKIMDKLNTHEMKKREGDKDERSNQKTRCD